MNDINSKRDRHNLLFNCAHEFFWGIGLSFHTVYAIIPLFLKQLGAPQGICLSVAGLWSILVAFPQLFTAIIGRNIKDIKHAVIGVHIFAMPPIFFVGFIFAFFAPTGPYSWLIYYTCFIFYVIGTHPVGRPGPRGGQRQIRISSKIIAKHFYNLQLRV